MGRVSKGLLDEMGMSEVRKHREWTRAGIAHGQKGLVHRMVKLWVTFERDEQNVHGRDLKYGSACWYRRRSKLLLYRLGSQKGEIECIN